MEHVIITDIVFSKMVLNVSLEFKNPKQLFFGYVLIKRHHLLKKGEKSNSKLFSVL